MIKKIIFVLLIVNIINLFFFGIFDLLTGYPTLFRTLGDVLNIFCFLLFYATKKNVKLKFYGGKYMLIFVLITLISMIINKTELILLAIFFRRMLVYYLLYIMVSNINFTLSQFEKLKKLLIGIFILQIPVSIIKLVFVGITEQNIGTLSILEGSLTTVFYTFCYFFFICLPVI